MTYTKREFTEELITHRKWSDASYANNNAPEAAEKRLASWFDANALELGEVESLRYQLRTTIESKVALEVKLMNAEQTIVALRNLKAAEGEDDDE